MGITAEDELVESGARLDATVLKVGHHGSAGSTGYVFLREVMPDYAVISVGTDNSYGHPTEAALSRPTCTASSTRSATGGASRSRPSAARRKRS